MSFGNNCSNDNSISLVESYKLKEVCKNILYKNQKRIY